MFLTVDYLGLSKAETKFDDISCPADIGDFLLNGSEDYSSGMFVRLAFAVTVNVSRNLIIEASSKGMWSFFLGGYDR